MKKLTKYLALFLVGTALVLGIIKLSHKEQLHFITPSLVQTTITIPTIAYKHKPPHKELDQKGRISLFSHNYLVVKVPKSSHPTALIYQNQSFPLIKLKEKKHFILYKTPFIPREIDKSSVKVQLLYEKKVGYKIPQEALIFYKGKHYVIVKKGDKLLPLLVTIQKKENNSYIVKQNLANLQIALISQEQLDKELQKLLVKKEKR